MRSTCSLHLDNKQETATTATTPTITTMTTITTMMTIKRSTIFSGKVQTFHYYFPEANKKRSTLFSGNVKTTVIVFYVAFVFVIVIATVETWKRTRMVPA